ncbi:MAG: helix-turn-helix transcriptional regulator [Phenylobacterium sp.]
MSFNIEFGLATSPQIERALGERLEAIRLSRNLTQAQVAEEAGISVSTLKRLERGGSISLDAFIRVLSALRLQDHLAALLPDPGVRPVERATRKGHVRQRARPKSRPAPASAWAWGSEEPA